jgi:hypothetical protein
MKNGVLWDVTPCNVSEELSASFIRLTRIDELGTALGFQIAYKEHRLCVRYRLCRSAAVTRNSFRLKDCQTAVMGNRVERTYNPDHRCALVLYRDHIKGDPNVHGNIKVCCGSERTEH